MTIEEKIIDHLYVLLAELKLGNTDSDTISALRWAIFTLEQVTK